MMKRAALLTATVALLALAACDNNKPSTETKPEEPAAKNAPTATPPVATAPVQAAVTVADSDLATSADFEEAAEKAITPKTYKTELASIEADLAKDKE